MGPDYIYEVRKVYWVMGLPIFATDKEFKQLFEHLEKSVFHD